MKNIFKVNRGQIINYLGIDYGESRIGIAKCSQDAKVSIPLDFIPNDQMSVQNIQKLITLHKIDTIFIGLPLSLDGEESLSSQKVRKFATVLERDDSIKVILVDERMSSVEVNKKLSEAGASPKQSRSIVDSLAACIILESGLSILKI